VKELLPDVAEPSSAPPVLIDESDITTSPFADPHYGFDAETKSDYVVASHPTWPLEETQKPLTGWIGALVVLTSAIVLVVTRFDQVPGTLLQFVWDHRIWFVFGAVFAGMAAVELVAYKVHRRHFDFSVARPIDRAAWSRIFARWGALLFCIGVALFLYIILKEYSFHIWDYPETFYYAKFRRFLIVAIPTLVGLSLPYFWMVERHARPKGPVDEFLVFARCLKRWFRGLFDKNFRADGTQAIYNPHVRNLSLGLLVKFFFVPLMLTGCVSNWIAWQTKGRQLIDDVPLLLWGTPEQTAMSWYQLHAAVLVFLFTLDMTIAVVGYICSVRLFDSQVTSAEPSFFGWAVALACYPPFNNAIFGNYLSGGITHDTWHRDVVAAMPQFAVAASIGIILFMSIYTWATFCFGLRFSNLTNRGVICCGPYKLVRHPAYICKNAAWWIACIPMMTVSFHAGVICVINLAMVTGVYFLRAITEERHLRREPHYREYCEKVPWRFIPGIY
jgi:protein-S-isoprenylcysteine O-methyltransferase Ste14